MLELDFRVGCDWFGGGFLLGNVLYEVIGGVGYWCMGFVC